MKWIVDDILPHRRLSLIFVAAALSFVTHVAQFVTSSAGAMASFRATQKMTLRIRIGILRKLSMLSLDYHESVSIGEKLYVIERDIEQVGEVGASTLRQVLNVLFSTVLTVGTIAFINAQLLWLVLPVNVCFLVHRRIFRRPLQEASDRTRTEASSATEILQEYLGFIPEFQIVGCQRTQLRKLIRAFSLRIRAEGHRAVVELGSNASSVLIIGLGVSGVLTYCGYHVVRGALSTGAFIACYAYLIRLFDPLGSAAEIFARFSRAKTSIHRLLQIMDARPTIQQAESAVALAKPIQGEIELKDVEFGYARSEAVVHDLDILVGPGQKVAIVGETGSGKTTIARLMARMYDVRSGTVRIDGRDVRELCLASLRGCLCYLPQQPLLLNCSLRENLLLGRPAATDPELREALGVAQLNKFTHCLSQCLGPRGDRLSGGERQRIAIARAILQNPQILILDECTSALDIRTEAKLMSALLKALPKTTIIAITHRVKSLEWAMRTFTLEGGRIVQEGRGSASAVEEHLYFEPIRSPL
jgi:ATP-binding cassette subfamily B protein